MYQHCDCALLVNNPGFQSYGRCGLYSVKFVNENSLFEWRDDMSILNQLKKKKLFSNSEMAVVDYILLHPKEVVKATIRELAERTYSSPSTIGRICKKVDVDGFTELKIKLAMELDRLVTEEHMIDMNMPVKPDDPIEDFPRIFFNLHYQALSDVYHGVDIKKLKQVADLLYQSDCVYVLGSQQSMILVQDFLCKTTRLGLSFENPGLSGFNTSLYKKKKCKKQSALLISRFANSSKINKWIDELKAMKSDICLITANSESPNINRVRHAIIINNEEMLHGKLGSFVARTEICYVLDLLYMLLFMKDYEENLSELMVRMKTTEWPDW